MAKVVSGALKQLSFSPTVWVEAGSNSPSTVIDYFVYLKKSTGELIGLLTDDNVTSREKK